MRWTVLSSDVLVLFPAVLSFLSVYYMGRGGSSKCIMAWHMAILLVNPSLILIDHGHFQVDFALILLFSFVCLVSSCHLLVEFSNDHFLFCFSITVSVWVLPLELWLLSYLRRTSLHVFCFPLPSIISRCIIFPLICLIHVYWLCLSFQMI